MEGKDAGEDKTIAALIEELATPNCAQAYEQLVELGSQAVPSLCKALPYSPFPVRVQVIRILGESRDQAALPALVYTRTTACWQLRLEAARAMQTIYLHHLIIATCWDDDPLDELLAD